MRSATVARIWSSISGVPRCRPEGDERPDRLAGVLVGLADHRRLGDRLGGDDRGLHLGGGEPVAGDVDDVVDAADHPEVAVLVPAGGVADEVGLLAEPGEVGLDEAVVLLVERAQHRGPRPLEHQQPLALVDRLALLLVDDLGLDPGERPCRRAGLGRGDPRQRRDHDRAGLGLPPGVDDRAALAADHLVVPEPRLRVDRLTDRAEQPQR